VCSHFTQGAVGERSRTIALRWDIQGFQPFQMMIKFRAFALIISHFQPLSPIFL
jgi:hypothetical protein